MFRIIGETKINFIGVRKIAFFVSLALIALGLYAFAMISTGNANMGIDFAGGVMVKGYFQNETTIEKLRSSVEAEFPNAQITQMQGFEKSPYAFIIKIKQPETEAGGKQKVDLLKTILTQNFEGNQFEIVSEHIIGPAVGETLRNDAQKAILLSLFGIVIYIWIRFDFRSGIAATIATFHDVLAVMGIFYIFGFEYDLLIVTALLTLAGYSLTDTVVVFDRIRENLKKYRTKGEFASAVNLSINDVLSRTFNTSITVIFVVGSLYLIGGDVLRGFSLAMILGVIIGTYSSIFVASPIVVEWEARRPVRFK